MAGNCIDRGSPSFWSSKNFVTHRLPVSAPLLDVSTTFRRKRCLYTHRIYRFAAQLLSILLPDYAKLRPSPDAVSSDLNGDSIDNLAEIVAADQADATGSTEPAVGNGSDSADAAVVIPVTPNMADYVDKLERWRTIELLYTAIRHHVIVHSILEKCGFYRENSEVIISRFS